MSTFGDAVYLRVLEDLRMRIREGTLEPGARVPSRNAIIANYGVGETAAKHALQVLMTEGLIEGRAGSGCYVRKVPPPRRLEHDRLGFPGSPFGVRESGSPGQDGTRAGSPPAAVRLSWEHQTQQLQQPPVHIGRRLGLGPGGGPVTVTSYLLTANGAPVQLATSYEPARLTEGTPVAVPEQGALAGRGVIERMRSIGVMVDSVLEDISVRPSLRAEASALAIPAGAPVLLVERLHVSGTQAVEAADIVIPAEHSLLRYRFDVAGRPQ